MSYLADTANMITAAKELCKQFPPKSTNLIFIKNFTLWQLTKVDAFEYVITALIIYIKKLLDSDWLRV